MPMIKKTLRLPRVPHWPVHRGIVAELRERREKYGIPVTRSIHDALSYALAHKAEWWDKRSEAK